jgi:hypothetical protein
MFFGYKIVIYQAEIAYGTDIKSGIQLIGGIMKNSITFLHEQNSLFLSQNYHLQNMIIVI